MKKASFGNLDSLAAQGEKLHMQVVYQPMHACEPLLLVKIGFSRLSHRPHRQGYRLQKTSFCILVGICCHNIPTHTPQSGYRRVNKIAKNTDIAKTTKLARPTPLHTNHMESGPENTFWAQNRKEPKDS